MRHRGGPSHLVPRGHEPAVPARLRASSDSAPILEMLGLQSYVGVNCLLLEDRLMTSLATFQSAPRATGVRSLRLRVAALVLITILLVTPGAECRAEASDDREDFPYRLPELGVTLLFPAGKPMPIPLQRLLQRDVVQEELKLTQAERSQQTALLTRYREKAEELRRKNPGQEALQAALTPLLDELRREFQESLRPEQWERLNQIQLQAAGPFAFASPDVQSKLNMSKERVSQVEVILNAGWKEMQDALRIPIKIAPRERPRTPQAARELLSSPEFQRAIEKARIASQDARAAILKRITSLLSEEQNGTFQEMLGEPFDVEKLRPRTMEGIVNDAIGQRADPSFDAKVASPAFTQNHPRAFIDEAHNNFHTAGGRYKPFADLLANDGFRVLANREVFRRGVLEKCDILVIANASSREGKSAFTDEECDAVRDWVASGGSLLLITDHSPYGEAAERLSLRFGVEMSKGVTRDPQHVDRDSGGLVFSRENGLLGDHPITKGRDQSETINRVLTFTGQSLKGPEGSVAFLNFADTAIDRAPPEGKEASAAGRSQGLALVFGKGRVVVLGEAAELSAQLMGLRPVGMNTPGTDNRQFALNIMHWLAGILD